MENNKHITPLEELTASQLAELEAMEQSEGLCLKAGEDCRFHAPQSLKRSTMEGFHGTLRDELCIARAEGDHADSHGQAADDDGFLTEVALLRGMRLQPDTTIVYGRKEALKHSAATRRLSARLWIPAAAAVVALLLATPMLLRKESNPGDAPVLAQKTVQPATTVAETQKTDNPVPTAAATGVEIASEEIVKRQSTSRIAAAKPGSGRTTQSGKTEQTAARFTSVATAQIQPVALALALEIQPVTVAFHDPGQTPARAEERYSGPSEARALLRDLALKAGLKERPRTNWLSDTRKSLDNLSDKSIIAINNLLAKETVIIKEYDKGGNLLRRAVRSETVEFERNYKN